MPTYKMNTDDKTANKADVGYKRPPVSRQFKPGRSGNPKGRPKGRPNVATLTKALLSEPVLVREGGKTRHMPACEAIVRALVADASRGDHRALFAIMDILEMTGRTNDISEEERAKRAMHLPDSFTLEEMDLLRTDACEKDRERCRMIAETDPERYASSEDGSLTVVVPAAIAAGDGRAAEGKLDEALAAYRGEVIACKQALTADDGNPKAQDDFRRAVARIGLLADTLLDAGEFDRAIEFADEALAEAATPFWVPKTTPIYNQVISSSTWISAIRAHACMLVGRVEEARKFYHSFNSDKRLLITSWETSILRDFVRLRKTGRVHHLMDEIEKRYADEGWTTENRNTKRTPPKMKGEDAVFVEMHPDNIKSGDTLREFGNLHEAMAVYLRNLKKWKANLAQDENCAEWKQNVRTAVERVVLTINGLFRLGRFITPLGYADEAIAIAPNHLLLHASRACALMLLGDRDNEARVLFLRHQGETVDDKSWEAVISDQFVELRKAGCTRPLMDEVEKRFAGMTMPETSDDMAPSTSSTEHSVSSTVSRLIRASDISSGVMLEEQGMLDEALTVYGRCLDVCKDKISKFANGQFNIQAIDDKNTVTEKIANLAIRFLNERNFARALETIDRALSAVPNLPTFTIYRAHALMFLDRVGEAKELYLRCRSEKIGPKQLGENLILQDYKAMREAALTHPLMDEMETLFTADAHNPLNFMEKTHE